MASCTLPCVHVLGQLASYFGLGGVKSLSVTWIEARTITPPPNDNLANAVAITPGLTGEAVIVTVDLADATLEVDETVFVGDGSPMYNSVWYTFAVPSNAATMMVRSGIAWE